MTRQSPILPALAAPSAMAAMAAMAVMLAAITMLAGGARAADPADGEPEAEVSELPPLPATEPSGAVATFQTRPGFVLKLVASEPQVTDPIEVCFDEDGRIYAVEMRGYSERREEALGRIRLLEDADGDGVFERSTVFAEDLKWPTSVTSFNGGVFVAVTPDILYLKDTSGDGVADVREVVFTGLAEGVPLEKLNMEGLANGLQWGPDNRIWATSSTSGGRLRRPDQQDSDGLDLKGRDFSFDPRTRELRAEHGGGQNGMSFDSLGRRYICSNSRHLMSVVWEQAWTAPSPLFPLPAPVVGIAVDGDAAPVFRISPDEPWRIVRTRWRVAGVVGGPVEGGGRVSGYFTGASGVTIYTGHAFGQNFVDDAFIADVGSNLAHRKVVRHADGGQAVALEARRPGDEEEREFLASRDNWFRPTNFANGPDGCLYVVDMYREVVEHPWSLPPGIKKHLDLNSGMDRGRIYRVEPEGFERGKPQRLGGAGSGELVAMLEHPNGWHRRTAQRLLWERGDARAGEGWAREPAPGSPHARFRKVLALAGSAEDEKVGELAEVAGGLEGDPWMEAVVLNALHTPEEAAQFWAALAPGGGEGASLRARLAEGIGRSGGAEAVRAVLEYAMAGDAGQVAGLGVLCALGAGLEAGGRSLAEAAEGRDLDPVVALASEVALDPSADDTSRVLAVRLSGLLGITDAMAALLDEDGSEALHLEAIEVLGRDKGDSLARAVAGSWARLSPRLRSAAIEGVMARRARALTFLEAVRDGRVGRDTLPPNAEAALRGHADENVRALAAKVIPEAATDSREESMARYRPALSLEGDSARGETWYLQLCSGCHRAGGRGHAAGPDVESFKAAGRESILASIIDPHRQVAPQFVAYTVALADGGAVAGIISRETTTELEVRQPFGLERTLLRKDVASMESAGLSLMPAGLEAAMTPDDMADLLAFIESL